MDRTPIPGFFKGMPTPAAALLVVAPLLLCSQSVDESIELARFWAVFSCSTMVVASVAMNLYPVHYLHIGRFMDRNPWFGNINILLVVFSVFTPYFGYIALLYLTLYLLSPAVTRRIEPPR
jgi:CDP-diacylglycerol--serine O-phosphatidyltransferase